MQCIRKWFKSKAMPAGGWWGIIHKNNFYKVTPISGWIFVYKAKNLNEMVFWYLACLAFLGIALYNVQYLFTIYYSQPTHSQIVFRTSTKDIDMPNMTLEINMPLTEFLTYLPLPFSTHKEVPLDIEFQNDICSHWNWEEEGQLERKWNEFMDKNPFWKNHISSKYRVRKQACHYKSVDDATSAMPMSLIKYDNHQLIYRYLCHEPHVHSVASAATLEYILSLSTELHRKSIGQLLQFTNDSKSKSDLFNDGVLKDWLSRMDKQQKKYVKYWKDLLSIPKETQEKFDVHTKLSVHTNQLLSQRPNNTLIKLLTLEAVQEGSDPRLKLLNQPLSNQRHVNNILDNLGKSIEDLIESIHSDLTSVIHFNVTGATLVFKGWRVGASSNEFFLKEPEQKLLFSVTVPKGIKHVQIDLYSFVYMWHNHILKALIDVAVDLVHYEYVSWTTLFELCPNGLRVDEMIIKAHNDLKFLYSPIIHVLNEKIKLEPGFKSNITIAPDHQFTSNTNNCFETGSCMDICLKERIFAQCSCVPWTLGIPDGSTICSEPCNNDQITQECNLECREKLHHPCNFMLPRLRKELAEFKHDEWFVTVDEPISSIALHMPEAYNFIESIEEYEISAEAFLSQIGGALEFWTGINLISIVHLVFYLIFNTWIKIIIDKLFSEVKTKLCQRSKVEPIRDEKIQPLRMAETNLIKSINSMRSRILKMLPDSASHRKRDWLKENKFYKMTPMAGYRYIAAAEKNLEACVWYTFIIVLVILTAFNLHNTMIDYYARPTRILIFPGVAEDLQLPNLTLKLYLPLFELNNFDQQPTHGSDLSASHLVDLYYGSESSITATDLYEDVLEKWSVALRNGRSPHFTPGSIKNNIWSLSHVETWKEWQAELDHSIKVLEEKSGRRMNLSEKELGQVYADLWGVLSGRAGDLGIKLFWMNALYNGNNELEPQGTNYNVTQILRKEMDITPRELLQDVLHHLSKMIHVSTNQPGTKAYVTHFNFNENPTQTHLVDSVIEINLLVPVNLSQIRIDVYTFVHSWFNRLYDWIERLELLDIDDRYWFLTQIHGYDLLKTGLEAYEFSVGHLYLTTGINSDILSDHSVQLALLKPGVVTFDIQPSWQMVSYTAECKDMIQEVCLESCSNHQYLTNCSCYPWHMFYLNDDGGENVCEEKCTLNEHKLYTECTETCKPCHHYLFASNQGNEPYTKFDSIEPSNGMNIDLTRNLTQQEPIPLFTAIAKMRQVTHPELMEQYEMTIGSLVSKIGGILDFWLGVNLLAVLHLAVFAVKHFVNLLKPTISENSRKMLIKAQGLKKEISELKDEINVSMNQQRCVDDAKDRKGWRYRFQWMSGNKFFEETGLTGFEFISGAGSALEVGFWWTLILTFCILTAANVWQAIHLYGLSPKHINVNLATGTDTFEIGNITLEMNMLFVELSGKNPSLFSYKYEDVNAWSVAEQIACSLVSTDAFHNLYLASMEENMFQEWLSKLKQPWDNVMNTSTGRVKQGSLNDPKMFNRWKATLSKTAIAIKTFLKKNGTKPKGSHLLNEFDTLMNSASQISENSVFTLMLLHAQSDGIDPKERLHELLTMRFTNDAYLNPNGSVERLGHKPIEQYFKHISSDQILRRGLHVISKFLHVMLDDPGTKIYLKDWSYELGENSAGVEMVKDQTLKLLLQVPPETRQITVKIYSYFHMWLEMILGAVYEYFVMDLGLSYALCDRNNVEDVQSLAYIHNAAIFTLREWSKWTKESKHLKVYHNKANQYLIEPYKTHEYITLVPTSYLESNTQNCYSGTMDHCFDECLLNAHKQICECSPWNLLYVESGKSLPICMKPCANESIKRNCTNECEEKLLHPCKIGNDYTFEYSHSVTPEYFLGDHVPYCAFSIVIPERSHAYMIYTESYSMTFGDFIAQVGGLFDLFMGLNLMSIIHMMVFVVREILISKIGKPNNSRDKSSEERVECVRQRLIEDVGQLENQVEFEIIKLSKNRRKGRFRMKRKMNTSNNIKVICE